MQIIHLNIGKVYQYQHITFEFHRYCGVTFLRRKDHEMKENYDRPLRDWKALERWCKMSPEEQQMYRII